MTTLEMMKTAKLAAPLLAQADSAAKDRALLAMADRLEASVEEILAANRLDVAAARDSVSAVMIDRLTLSEGRVRDMADGVRQVAKLPDPVGTVRREVVRPNGLVIHRVGVPLGVIAIIYESRPNVTSDAAAQAVKSGNACILRDGTRILIAWEAGETEKTPPDENLSVRGIVFRENADGTIAPLTVYFRETDLVLSY